jgi:hypothetical protein
VTGTWSSEPITEVYFEPTYYDDFFLPVASVSLGRSFAEVDVGGTWALDNFADYAAKLTDGSNQFLGLRSFLGTGGGSSLVPESVYWNFSGGIFGPDLSGYIITGIDFTLNALTISRPGSDPNDDGNWSEAHFTTTLTVHGEAVPEGAPFVLPILGSCLSGLALFRSRSGRGK